MNYLQISQISPYIDIPIIPLILGSNFKLGENQQTLFKSSRSRPIVRLKASRIHRTLIKKVEASMEKMADEAANRSDPFTDLKQNFLSFKRDKYLGNMEHYQNLADIQTPKFTVIACADSRVCPSNILGLQPGDAFTVRQVANLVPPFEVENILVIGHSRCGGIRALMSMEDDEKNSRSFIRNWVIIGKNAKARTKSVTSELSLDQQCQHCEKESINHSLMNLLTYPWIKERVANDKLSLHGGYYDFVNCTFEKWTLDCHGSDLKSYDFDNYSIKNREFWK